MKTILNEMNNIISVGILGGTGYGAGELLRILSNHPNVEIVNVVSSSNAGEKISEFHKHLRGINDLYFDDKFKPESFISKNRVLFSCLPHGTTTDFYAKIKDQLDSHNISFIDLSGDFRLKVKTVHEKFYPEAISSEEDRSQFVYGLPELHREEIPSYRKIANPGCLSSSAILALAPLSKENFEGSIVIDAKTGTSGGGRGLNANFHHATRHASISAYKILEHRHEPEILQELGDPSGERIKTIFVPHLLPVSRGILVTAYCTVDKEVSTEDLQRRYQEFFKGSPFIRIIKDSPELYNVIGSNFVDIFVQSRGNQVVAIAALDNLVKGMAGTAIQNMNLIFGLNETTGLLYPSFGPI